MLIVVPDGYFTKGICCIARLGYIISIVSFSAFWQWIRHQESLVGVTAVLT